MSSRQAIRSPISRAIRSPLLRAMRGALDGLGVLTAKGATLFLPSTSTCFSDTGGTTPAVVDGPVARINSTTATGIFASQATSANQPILRRGPKNLLLFSNTLTNAAWTKANATVSGSTVTTTLAAHAVYNQFTVIPLLTYTFQFKAQRGTMTDLKYSVYDATNAADIVSPTTYFSQTNGSTATTITVTFTAPFGCVSARVYAVRDSGVTGTVVLSDCQVEVGESAGAYAVTTASQASAGTGSYWLDFDGVNDTLAMSAIPWTNTQDQFVTLAASFQNTAAATLFSNRGSATGAGANGGVSTDIGWTFPNVEARWRDTSSNTVTIPQRYTFGNASVFSARQTGSLKTHRFNGGSALDYTLASGSAALAGSLIGAVYNATPFNFFTGALYAMAFGPATMQDAELLAVESYIATQASVSTGYTFPQFIGSVYNTDTANFMQIRPRRILSYAGAVGSQNRQSREIGNIVYNPGADAMRQYMMWWSSGPSPYTGVNTAVWAAWAPTIDGPWSTSSSAVISNATLPIEDPYVYLESGVYHLVGENKTGNTNNLGICHFTSSDGLTWTRQDSDVSPWFDKGAGWDNKDASSPILWKEGSTYYLIYEGRDIATNTGKIGLATATSVNGPFTRVGAAPVYSGNTGSWDDHDTVPDDIKKVGSTYYLMYHGTNAGGLWGVGYITSTDLVNWSRPTPYQVFGSSFNFEAMWHLESDKVVAIDGDLTGAPGKPGNINVWTLL